MSAGLFLKEFLRAPGSVGAVWPSSPGLARLMVEQGGVAGASSVVEIGPGTGAFTGEILAALAPEARFVAVERSEPLARALGERFPQARIHRDSAENLPAILASEGILGVDALLSGLPWAAFPGPLQDRLLGACWEQLAPGGRFVTFAYLQGLLLPAGRDFARKIRSRFRVVEASRVVWANLPPAFVYRCLR